MIEDRYDFSDVITEYRTCHSDYIDQYTPPLFLSIGTKRTGMTGW
jgi:hypothetical protein